MKGKRKKTAAGLLTLILLLNISAFALLAFRDESVIDTGAFMVGGITVALILAHYVILTGIFKHIDRHLLIVVYVLISISMIMQYRINVEIAFKQLTWISIGMALMCVMLILMRYLEFLKKAVWVLMIGTAGLLALVLLVGQTTGGAKNWINLAGFSFQPSEFGKIALGFVLATWLTRRQRFFSLWPLWAFLLACIGILVLSRDLGAAVIYALMTLIVYYVGTGNTWMTLAGAGVGAVGAVGAYAVFDHVKVRVAAWRNPWASYETSGYQIAQGLMAIASGGLFGLGLTRGAPKTIPAYHTDYIFAVICEEMGLVVGLFVIVFFLVLILRCARAAADSTDSFCALLATAMASGFALQTFLILGGVIKMIPLTGVTLPFVSYGGSSMITSFIMVGIVEAIAIRNGARLEQEARDSLLVE